MRLRIREITRQICSQLGVRILKGVLSNNHVHMFVEIPPKISVSDYMRRVKGCTARKIQQEFPELRQRYWGKSFELCSKVVYDMIKRRSNADCL